jgi:uncharacterized protein
VISVDVNLLVYAFRVDAPHHRDYLRWWEEQAVSPQPIGIADLVLSGFLRLVTHPRIFDPPTPIDQAVRFTEVIKSLPNYVEIRPGPRHWGLFLDLCRKAKAQGNLIPDAYLAALAIESGCEWITADRSYGRFPGLRWKTPF